jgi:hypothetical protein
MCRGTVAQVVLLLAVLAAVIALARRLSRDRRIDRRVWAAGRRAISEFADGAVAAVSGTVYPADRPFAAPLSGRACIYYEVEIQAFDSSSLMWATVHSECAGQDFLIQDATGTALVRSGRWMISVKRDAPFANASWSETDPVLDRFLQRVDLLDPRRRQLRCRERLLLAGERVAVSGPGMREPDPEPRATPGGYRAVALRLTLHGGCARPLYITDHLGRAR